MSHPNGWMPPPHSGWQTPSAHEWVLERDVILLRSELESQGRSLHGKLDMMLDRMHTLPAEIVSQIGGRAAKAEPPREKFSETIRAMTELLKVAFPYALLALAIFGRLTWPEVLPFLLRLAG